MPHIGDELHDRGHGVRLLERPVGDLHHPIIILREPVIAHLKLLDGKVTSPNGFMASGNAMFREDNLPKLNMPGAKGPGIG